LTDISEPQVIHSEQKKSTYIFNSSIFNQTVFRFNGTDQKYNL